MFDADAEDESGRSGRVSGQSGEESGEAVTPPTGPQPPPSSVEGTGAHGPSAGGRLPWFGLGQALSRRSLHLDFMRASR